MSDVERGSQDELRALRALDSYYGMSLGCAVTDLRRSGWTFLSARAEGDPMALLFGQRSLVHLLAPTPLGYAPLSNRPGVASLAPELRDSLRRLLLILTPERLYTPDGLRMVDALVRAHTPEPLSPTSAAHLCVRYTTSASFKPTLSQWQEWIEPLDETSEMDRAALLLLARFGGGVFVVRQGGRILAHVGVRSHSPHIAEAILSDDPSGAQRSGLAQALLARATRAILATKRIPIVTYPAHDRQSHQLTTVLGYRSYADATVYMSHMQ